MKTILNSKNLENIVLQLAICDIDDVVTIEDLRLKLIATQKGNQGSVSGFNIFVVDDTYNDVFIGYCPFEDITSIELVPERLRYYSAFTLSLKYL